MWEKVKKILGYIWASPVTFAGLVYALPCAALGWYEWHGRIEDGLVWRVNPTCPAWLKKLWMKWSGHAIGNVVVLNVDPEKKQQVVQHELVHVRQVMRLGVFQPIIYGINLVAIKLGCEASDPYYDNLFEIDARRAVGQTVDVVGALKSYRDAKASLEKKEEQ